MPVWKYRTHQEAEEALWLPPGDPRLWETWRTLAAMSKLAPECPPERGVKRFLTIEEANTDTEAWIQRRVDAGRGRVRPQPMPEAPHS